MANEMSTEFASEMSRAVETLGENTTAFVESTITDGIWQGRAAESAGSYFANKINPKVSQASSKLLALVAAIEEGNLAIQAQEKEEKARKLANEIFNKINTSDKPSQQDYADLRNAKEDVQKYHNEYVEHVKNVKNKCNDGENIEGTSGDDD